MSEILSTITDPTPSELPKLSELPELEEGSEKGESDYETALAYQNTDTRWFTQWIGSENDFCDLSQDWLIIKANLNEILQEAHIHYNDEANAIFWRSDGQIDLKKTRGLTWAKPYKEIATELDFNEYYPHILAYGSTCWPIGLGEFKIFIYISINPINFNLKYGIYHVFIGGQPAGQKYEIFYQWASYLTEIKHEGGQADRRRPGPHRHMASFISARGRKTVSEKIRSLGDHIKRVHTDKFILSGKISDQVIGKQAGELKIVNAGNVSIKNAMRLEWTNFEEIIPTTSTKLKESTIHYVTAMPNEIFERIFQYHSMNREKINISRVKFTNALSKNTKPKLCEQLSFENCGSRIINNKNLDAFLVECPNLKSLAIRGSRRLSPKTITKIPKLAPNLEMIEISNCLQIRKDIIADFQNLYPTIRLIFIDYLKQ
ncbi:36617_t:CDS:2 [Racocetra persica]|uniref:36617_t:CDS:1 n=1 Tax=Racocetra persica TaxID=160502 RepID=A0ACA9LA85_9GLOM|nr:36617_t:CDS:2 [Racocetra persica]